jgi:hypothetical protein
MISHVAAAGPARQLSGLDLRCGDDAALSDESVIERHAMTGSEILFFDVA